MQKRCSKCRQIKSIDDFPRHKGYKDGRDYYCKPCHNARRKEQRQREKQRDPVAFKNKIVSRLNKWLEDNPDKAREAAARQRKRKYWRKKGIELSSPEYLAYQEKRQVEIAYRKTPEYKRTKAEEYRRANLEKVSLRVRRWQKNHPGREREQSKLRRRAKSAKFPSTNAIKLRIRLFDNLCAYCGGPYEHLDHVIPVSSGGMDNPENIVPCCGKCNSRKNNREWVGWFRKQPTYSVEREELIMASMQYTKTD